MHLSSPSTDRTPPLSPPASRAEVKAPRRDLQTILNLEDSKWLLVPLRVSNVLSKVCLFRSHHRTFRTLLDNLQLKRVSHRQ